MLSTINLIGRPIRDPEQTSTKSGIRYIKIDVAVNKGYGEKEHVNLYSCWLKEDIGDRLIRGRALQARCKKGSLISIIGDLDVKTKSRAFRESGRGMRLQSCFGLTDSMPP